jgi:DNA invertase Pin-like site-specific DNA recombinase
MRDTALRARDTTGQVAALKEAGCDSIFTEKGSGGATNRKQLGRTIAAPEPGDVLVVTKLDRLARSMRDLLNTLQAVADRGAGFKVLDTPALDTTNAYGQLLLNVLGALAQFERELILSRTRKAELGTSLMAASWAAKPSSPDPGQDSQDDA